MYNGLALFFHHLFQHTAAQRRLLIVTRCRLLCGQSFQHTAARRRLQQEAAELKDLSFVSKHSRTKAAATRAVSQDIADVFQHTAARRRLRAQP